MKTVNVHEAKTHLSRLLARVERGHAQDLADVDVMLRRSLVNAAGLREYFDAIEPMLYRFPAIDAASFRQAVLEVVGPVG